MPWSLQWGEVTLHEDDLTLDQAELIEKDTGESWVVITPYRSVKHAKSVLAYARHWHDGTPVDESKRELGGMKVDAVLALLTFERVSTLPTEFDDNGNPPLAGEVSTGT